MKKVKFRRIRPEKLRRNCDPASFAFETTDELAPIGTMVGQVRALRAIDLGLEIPTRGFNIFALGESGSGKTTNILRQLERKAATEPLPDDMCYVYDFENPARPRVLRLPAGQGRLLAKAMDGFVRELKRIIARVLSDKVFGQERERLRADAIRKADRLFRRYETQARAAGLSLREEEDRIAVLPVVDGNVLDMERFEALPRKVQRQIEAAAAAFRDKTMDYARERRRLDRKELQRLLDAERENVEPIVKEMVKELKDELGKHGDTVQRFLDQVEAHVLANHRRFIPAEELGEIVEHEEPEEEAPNFFRVFEVNVLVDRSHTEGAPVVVERSPTLWNLVGQFEYREVAGALRTDHTLIRPGVLHRANGGYLVLQAEDLLLEENAWVALKKALRQKEIRIEEEHGTEGRPRLAGQLEPEPVPLSTKVILIGSPDIYYHLKNEDDEFNRLFKVKADFETVIPRTRENELKVAKLLGQVAREEGLLPLRREAVARIVEYGSRIAEDQRRISARYAGMLDLMAEAAAFSRRHRRKLVIAEDVDRALKDRFRRHSKIAELVMREFAEGTILLNTGGHVVGQVNAIAIYDLGDFAFGVPCRITARTYVGRGGVMNIDREAKLSGAIHDKGALIMVGFLGGRFAQDKPLSLSASITFEQSYEEIEGDSASSSELLALLSSLANAPIRQSIAVTGSVNQLGEIQPIGGVNEKIEGIFHIWRLRGLSSDEGVMIPQKNLTHLMLSDEVISAVRKGKFNIYAVEHIDQAIEILTGVPAGKKRRDGTWEPGTINDLVDKRLRDLSIRLTECETFRRPFEEK